MSDAKKIGITGATGVLGVSLLERLNGQSELVALVRNPTGVELLSPVEVREFDFNKPASFSSFSGLSTLILNGIDACMDLPNLMKAVQASGVKHIVLISGVGANARKNHMFHQIEAEVSATSIPCTILRMNWLMQNFATFLWMDVLLEGSMRFPAGESKTCFVDARDVADVVALVAGSSDYFGDILELSGPAALSFTEAAAEISACFGSQVRYEAMSETEFREAYSDRGYSEDAMQCILDLTRDMQDGITGVPSMDIQRVTGNPPRTFADFAKSIAWQQLA